MDRQKKKLKVEKMANTGRHVGTDVFSVIERNNQFLTNMAYQMRTALNAITGFSEILAMDELQYEQKEHVFEINRASRAVAHLLNDVIDFTKISPQKDCDIRDCNIDEVLDEIKSVIGFRAESRGVALKIVKKADMPVQNIKTNHRSFLECITRLADMTVKLANTDTVEIRVKSDCPEFIVFEFCGGNIALHEDIIKDLFEPFSVNLDEVYKDIEDTGLGFAVAAKLCHSIGADISVGQVGTLFVLTVPSGGVLEPQRSRLVDEFIKQKKTQKDFEPMKLNRSPRILVAEDNSSNQMVIKLLLGKIGCETDIVSNGVEAVEKACSEDYDAILMDIRMPEMDGIEAAGIIIDKGVVCPIIALTALDESQLDNNSQHSRFDAHIYKPIDAESLKNVLGRFLIFEDAVENQRV